MFKWVGYIFLSIAIIVGSFVFLLLSTISYTIGKYEPNLYDISNWYEENKNEQPITDNDGNIFDPSNITYQFEYYEHNSNTYLIDKKQNKVIINNQTNKTNIYNFIETKILNDNNLHTFINNIYELNTTYSITEYDLEYSLETDISIDDYFSNQSLQNKILISTNNESKTLKENTYFSLPIKINFAKITSLDISKMRNILFNNVVFIECSEITNVSDDEIDGWKNFDYAGKGYYDHIADLHNNIIKKIYDIYGYTINSSLITIDINTNNIINRNFTINHIVIAQLTINDSYFTSQTINIQFYIGTTQLLNMNVIYNSIENDINSDNILEVEFNVHNPLILTNDEIEKHIWNNNKVWEYLQRILTLYIVGENIYDSNNLVKMEIIKSYLIIEISYDYRYIRNYSQQIEIQYNVSSQDKNKILGDDIILPVKIKGIKKINKITTNHGKSSGGSLINYFGVLNHEGVNLGLFWAWSYGFWEIKLKSLDITFSYDVVQLDLLENNRSYTYEELKGVGFFNYGGSIPTINTLNSTILLMQNDYVNVDYPWLSWIGVLTGIDGGLCSLDSAKPISIEENWETHGKDWIVPGSRDHDFHLRLENLWENVTFHKTTYSYEGTDTEIIEANFANNGNIKWNFAKYSRFSVDTWFTSQKMGEYPRGSFNITSQNITSYDENIKTY